MMRRRQKIINECNEHLLNIYIINSKKCKICNRDLSSDDKIIMKHLRTCPLCLNKIELKDYMSTSIFI